MLPWQPFLAFYICGAHWRHLKNTTEPSMCGGDAALCQITLTTLSIYYRPSSVVCLSVGRTVCHVVSPAKTAEPIEMPFVLWARMGAKNQLLDGGSDPHGKGQFYGGKDGPL